MKKYMILLLTLIFAINSIFTGNVKAAEDIYSKSKFDIKHFEKMNGQKVIYQDENKIIIEVEAKDVYGQGVYARKSNDTKVMSWYPEGRILSQSKLYKSDIKDAVIRMKGTSFWSTAISNPVMDTVVTTLIGAIGGGTVGGFIGAVIGWSASYILQKQESWWKDSLIMILEGDISYVQQTIIENPHEYPKVFLIYERLK